jgi:hypothetical protein
MPYLDFVFLFAVVFLAAGRFPEVFLAVLAVLAVLAAGIAATFFAEIRAVGFRFGWGFARLRAFAPATPPTTAPTAAPSGPNNDPAAAPAAAPPTMPRPDVESLDCVPVFLAFAIPHPLNWSIPKRPLGEQLPLPARRRSARRPTCRIVLRSIPAR